MEHKHKFKTRRTSFRSSNILRSLICITIQLCTLLLYANIGFGQTPMGKQADQTPGPNDVWTMSLAGTRTFPATNQSSNTGTIYDDDGWNCHNQFLIPTYVGDPVTFDYYGPAYQPFSSTYQNKVEIIDFATGAPVYTGYITNTGGNLTTAGTASLTFNANAKGFYQISVSYKSSPTVTNYIVGLFTVQPKIQSLWLELPEICAPDYIQNHPNQPYSFKVKSIPDLNTITVRDIQQEAGPAPCALYEPTYMTLEGNALLGNTVTAINNTDAPTSYSPGYHHTIYGSTWFSGSGAYSVFPPNLEDYTIPYNDLLNYISPSGAFYNHTENITFEINDGISIFTTTASLLVNHATSTTNSAPSPAAFHLDNYDVYGTQTWTPTNNPIASALGTSVANIRIEKTLRIAPNAILTIQDMTLEFGAQGIVNVETAPGSSNYGGYLKLDNTTLTALHTCGLNQNLWQGVRVWGDATQPQAATQLSTGQGPQGTLSMINNSEISYANWGIINGGPMYKSGPVANKPWNTSGGVIICSSSKFYNNARAVNYGIYPVASMTPSSSISIPYRSSFTKCAFTEDANAPSFIGFISGWAVNGVAIYGSSFTDNTGNPGTSYRYGINGYDFGVKVDRYVNPGTGSYLATSFYNLNHGVELSGVNSNPTSAIIRNCLFDNNNTGAHIDALHAPQVQVNTFNITANSSIPQKLGLYLATSSAYGVTYNSFAPKPGARFTVGVVISGTGDQPNKVAKNDYNTIWAANLSNYINRSAQPMNKQGLQFVCNTNSNNVWDIAATGSGSNPDEGMCDFQGSSTKAAGNTFTSSAYQNIFNDPITVHPIDYYAGAATNEIPTNITGTTLHTFSTNNTCSTTDYPDPNASGPTRDPNGRLGHKGMRIAHFLSDPDGMEHRDSLYIELGDWHSAYSDLLKTDMLFQDGDTSDANSVYNAIVANDSLYGVEAIEFSYWGRKLMDIKQAQLLAGVTPDSLTASEVMTLGTVADSAQMWARDRARGWLHIYDGRTFTTDMVFPVDTVSGGGSARMAPNYTAIIASESFYNVSPNPATYELQVSYQKADGAVERFILTDITGKVVAQSVLNGKAGTCTVELRGMQSGMYLYRIMNGKTVKQSGKISKQ